MKDSIFFVILKNEGEKIAYWVFKELFGEGIKNVDVRHGTGAGFFVRCCSHVPSLKFSRTFKDKVTFLAKNLKVAFHFSRWH